MDCKRMLPGAVTRIAILLTIMTLACAGPAQALEKVVLRLDWTVYGIHAPFFLGKDNGFYREEGIDLDILEGQGSVTTIKLVGTGSDPFGVADYGAMAKAVAAGVPAKAILGLTQTSGMAIFSLSGSGIKRPKDLEGRIVAMTQGDALTQVFPALMAANNVDINKIKLVYTTTAGKRTAVLEKKVDAMSSYIYQVLFMESTGARIDVMKYADHGVNVLAHGIITSERMIAEKPDLVRRVVKATARSWTASRDNPGAALKAVIKHHKQFAPDLKEEDKEKFILKELEMVFALIPTPATAGKPFGWMAESDWAATQDLLVKYAGLSKRNDINVYFTNQFVPK